ncbi:MAG: hypothetical protein K1X39_08795 [Thermoflexales bacterium]|nr:hypothetical protein [Thermoflexales bacterium]
MKKLFAFLDSPLVFVVATVLIVGVGVANTLLFPTSATLSIDSVWAQRLDWASFVEVAYLLLAPRYIFSLTPGLVARLRPAVGVPTSDFDRIEKRIADPWPVRLLTVIALLIMADFVGRLLIVAANPAAYNGGELGRESGRYMLPLELFILAVATWRMFWLSRLAVRPLAISLLNPAPVYPFGTLSFSYASLLSLRILARLVLFGSIQGTMMGSAFTLFGVMSLLMLIVPILGTHNQMLVAKTRALLEIDKELVSLTKPIFAPDALPISNLAAMTAPVEQLLTLRNRVNGLWTWPVSSSLKAAQALVFSLLPAWLPLIKNYVWPVLQTLLGAASG